jgi:hypothetical protein
VTAKPSPLDRLSAAYRLDGSEEAWLDGLAESFGRAIAPLGGLGTTAHVATGRKVGFNAMKMAPPVLQDGRFFANQLASTASVVTGLGEALTAHLRDRIRLPPPGGRRIALA